MTTTIIDLYQQKTGKTIPDSQLPMYEAFGARALAELESMLGWSLSASPAVRILGVTPKNCDCDVKIEDLGEAPEIKGKCRIFSFNDKEPYVHIDPFTKVHAVYLCKISPEGKNITTSAKDVIITAKITDYSVRFFRENLGKYLKACKQMSICQSLCNQDCLNCTSLLVDGDWLDLEGLSDDLIYLICDYIDWLVMDGPASRGLEREKVDGHEVAYASWWTNGPYGSDSGLNLIQLFAGPYGIFDRKRIR